MQLRVELGPFGDAARDDSRYGGRESQKEEKLDQAIAAFLRQDIGSAHEVDAICDAVADEEIGNRGYAEIGKYLDQCIDLVLPAHGPQFQESETGMHRQHHNCSEQHEHHVGTRLESVHSLST